MAQRLATFIITVSGKEVSRFAFNKGAEAKVHIGKDAQNTDVIIDQRFMSRRHLELIKDKNDRLYVVDLNSKNGVFVNGKKIVPGKKTEIRIGDILSFMRSSTVQLLIMNPSVSHSKKNRTEEPKETFRIIDLVKKKSRVSVGRSKKCDITIDSSSVSRIHASLEKDEKGNFYIIDNDSTNGTFVNGQRIKEKKTIYKTDKIKTGKVLFTLLDRMGYLDKKAFESSNNKKLIELLKKQSSVIIGRSNEADITIKDNIVSRKHARITKKGNRYILEDINSTNGVFVNGKKINGKKEISPSDEVRIGLALFKLNDDLDEKVLEKNKLTAIRAEGITKTFENGYVGIQPMSFSVPSRSFVAVMGPSGCGKTTLMNMLNGADPASGGKVYIHGLELTRNFEMLKQKIGYVPQDDIVHKELTVNQSLYYAAKLKMNEDTTEEEIQQRINEVCKNLNINDKEIRENKVKNLSGGQRKRVSIAVELLNNPVVLFLDEPTSPLDPETIDGFLKSIKSLTVLEQTTVIMVTHKPTDLPYADKIIFLGKKGYPAYYGNEKDLFGYFGIKSGNIADIYSLLSHTDQSFRWYENWEKIHKASGAKEDPSKVNHKGRYSPFRQFVWLTRRYANIKLNDKANMAILIIQPIIIPIALIYIFTELQLGVLFLMAISAIWLGVSNAAKEIVEEMPIYKRERLFNLKILPYLFSKIVFLSFIALVQVAIFILILKLRFSSGEIRLVNVPQMAVFMFYLAFSASLLGLLLSVLFNSSKQVMSVIPIILIPQIIFAGVIANINSKDKEILSYTMLSRWGTEGLARIQDNHTAYKVYEYSPNDYLYIQHNGNKSSKIRIGDYCERSGDKVLCEPVVKSVYEKVPAFYVSQDTAIIHNGHVMPFSRQTGCRLIKTDPLKILGFYENHDLINLFNSLRKNMFAITLLNIITFIALYFALKGKDKI